MARQILSLVEMLWMLAALTGFPQLIDPEVLRKLAIFYFIGMLTLQVIPLVMTYNGNFGHRWHQVNVVYGMLAWVGIFGTVLLAVVFGMSGGAGVTIVAGALMFTGIVGSTVVAFFARPWRDWGFHQRESEYLEKLENLSDARMERRSQLQSALRGRGAGSEDDQSTDS